MCLITTLITALLISLYVVAQFPTFVLKPYFNHTQPLFPGHEHYLLRIVKGPIFSACPVMACPAIAYSLHEELSFSYRIDCVCTPQRRCLCQT